MKLQKKRIGAVLQQVLHDPDVEKIIFYLKDKANISEFIIAEELDLEIHRTRNLLYKLLDHNIVTFKRKKDKIKGWYICYWDFNESSILHLEEKYRLEEMEKIRERLNREQSGMFYMCRYAHVRMGFEEAFEQNFKCPECGELMNQLDNARTINFLTDKLEELETLQAEYEESIKPKKVVKAVPKVPAKSKAVDKVVKAVTKKKKTPAKTKSTTKPKVGSKTKTTSKTKSTTKTKTTSKRKVTAKTKTPTKTKAATKTKTTTKRKVTAKAKAVSKTKRAATAAKVGTSRAGAIKA